MSVIRLIYLEKSADFSTVCQVLDSALGHVEQRWATSALPAQAQVPSETEHCTCTHNLFVRVDLCSGDNRKVVALIPTSPWPIGAFILFSRLQPASWHRCDPLRLALATSCAKHPSHRSDARRGRMSRAHPWPARARGRYQRAAEHRHACQDERTRQRRSVTCNRSKTISFERR